MKTTINDDNLGKVLVETTNEKGVTTVEMKDFDDDFRLLKTFTLKVPEKSFHRRLRKNKQWYIEDSDNIEV